MFRGVQKVIGNQVSSCSSLGLKSIGATLHTESLISDCPAEGRKRWRKQWKDGNPKAHMRCGRERRRDTWGHLRGTEAIVGVVGVVGAWITHVGHAG